MSYFFLFSSVYLFSFSLKLCDMSGDILKIQLCLLLHGIQFIWLNPVVLTSSECIPRIVINLKMDNSLLWVEELKVNISLQIEVYNKGM